MFSTVHSSRTADPSQAYMNELFRRFAHRTSMIVGSPWAFLTATLVVVGWAVTGPAFGFSNTWQLVINTGTTIVTFLVVFLIQNTQNRDAQAMHLKLDELIRATRTARNELVDVEEMSDAELARLQQQFRELHGQRDAAPKPAKRAMAQIAEAAETVTEAVDAEMRERRKRRRRRRRRPPDEGTGSGEEG